jgi:deoxyribose-phosphate aldolase
MIVGEKQLIKSIDHTNLKADATEGDIRKLCAEAIRFQFASVFVNPTHVKLAADLLQGSSVRVGSVVGFPLGATTTTVKCFETINNIVSGAREIDFVINLGFLKTRKYDDLYHDMKAVVMSAKREQLANKNTSIITKAILECCYLTDEEIKVACKLLTQAGVDFAKTSTGMGSYGATERHVTLLRRNLPLEIGIKASGGIKTVEQAVNFITLGANRIGTSSSVKIMEEFLKSSKLQTKTAK